MALAASRDEIVAAANAMVPSTATMYELKSDGPLKMEAKYRDVANSTKYEVEVDNATGKVLEFKTKIYNISKSLSVGKSEADIKAIVLQEYPDAQNLFIKLDSDNGKYEYEAKFSNEQCYEVELDLNAASGQIVERKLKFK